MYGITATATATFRDIEMGKKSNFLISLEDYAEASTVHGVGYVFSRTQIYFTAFSHQSHAVLCDEADLVKVS